VEGGGAPLTSSVCLISNFENINVITRAGGGGGGGKQRVMTKQVSTILHQSVS
jgi:hypothetical protein